MYLKTIFQCKNLSSGIRSSRMPLLTIQIKMKLVIVTAMLVCFSSFEGWSYKFNILRLKLFHWSLSCNNKVNSSGIQNMPVNNDNKNSAIACIYICANLSNCCSKSLELIR